MLLGIVLLFFLLLFEKYHFKATLLLHEDDKNSHLKTAFFVFIQIILH